MEARAAPLEPDERRAELEHEEQPELAACMPGALTLQPEALEHLLARGDEGEGAHARRRAERSPFELESSELSAAEGANRPFDGREVGEPRHLMREAIRRPSGSDEGGHQDLMREAIGRPSDEGGHQDLMREAIRI